MQELKIDPEFKDLIPPLTEDEYSRLEKSILRDGCRDALIEWDGTLVDGHNRYRICKKHNIPFNVQSTFFNDRNEAKLWMMQNQLARRNLNDAQRIAIVYKCEDVVKAKARERQATSTGGAEPQLRENFPEADNKRARDELGSMAGVSGKTYEHAVKVMQDAPDIISQTMTAGKLSINKAYEVVKAEPELQQEIALRLADMDAEPETNTPAKIVDEVLNRPHVANNSGNNEWYTPADYVELARKVMGSIDLDPASTEKANEVVQATTYYNESNDGLQHEWFGNVWLNPPYSSNLIGKFTSKLIADLPNISNAIVLVNNATETEWFAKLVANASAICFPYSRVRFYSPDGRIAQPLQGQALLYFGPAAMTFVSEFSSKGWCAYPA